MKGEWTITAKKKILENQWRPIEEWKMRTPSGVDLSMTIQMVQDAVVVFGITQEKKILVIHQYFFAHKQKFPTLIAGAIEDKGPLAQAKQELLEEAGCIAKEFILLGSSVCGKYSTGKLHYVLALEVEQKHDQVLEVAEDIDLSFVEMADFEKLLEEPLLQDAGVVACAYRALLYLKEHSLA